ncbi:imidazole glycerol phosphate synthase subunit HisH [Fuscovulum ytuae]|uniref:Imidazole glycerol phosphate synthase subunit HisH n=1 Tax=Fuscovulum ytuae TaxID=3042299 RepID=A0ABY8Q3J8_9RHOB|nr:imidazole glycerol phosphate synthase subunit HisH [Fuscovulum sp. YMD61]WGV15419.1 imidazole glycerol phosphate synthase subunit HisH [Fuscovulum sp. YMD61]
MSSKCVVIDYGSGNVFSVMHALLSLWVEADLSSDPDRILAADRVVLPGVGAFRRTAERLRGLGFDETTSAFITTGRPFLGICVGMQLLMEEGHDFGTRSGLGIFPGTVDKVDITEEDGCRLRVPLISWYLMTPLPGQDASVFRGTPLEGAPDGDAHYFVHSFAVRPADPVAVLATVSQAEQPVPAAIRKDNVFGVQFHPERSGEAGLALLDRFLKL